VCENWKGYAVKHNYVNQDVLMTILDNCMFRPLLAIFRLSSREFKVLIYIYIGCPRRNVPDFGRVYLMLKYTDITQNTYVQS